jgi:hypothetical protein
MISGVYTTSITANQLVQSGAPQQLTATYSGDANFATSTLQSSTTPLPTSLSGSTVQVTDAAGVPRLAPLSFVSMGQIDFMIPTNTAAGLASVTATVNGQSLPVAYAGPEAQFFGEDQVNLGPLPSFAGAGTVNVQITVNGEPSNTVTVNFQ